MKITMLFTAVLFSMAFVYCKDISGSIDGEDKKGKGSKNGKKKKGSDAVLASSAVNIIKRWDLPGELKEVSGIAYMEDNRFACVQDEEGVIYIYNSQSGKIEKRIPFAEAGDYEDIAISNELAYVVRADGNIFEVDLAKTNGNAQSYKTPLTVEHNIEGLCLDRKNNRLLLAIKDNEPGNKDYKGVYAFDLAKKTLVKEPVYKIDLQHKMLSSKDKKNYIAPSAIAIHPQTNQIYVTDGPKSRLLILDPSGKFKDILTLGKSFEQPEGISFSANGELYISNEGSKSAGNIIQVSIP